MWFVKIALRQPITVIVMVLLIVLAGLRAALDTPIDMFPNVKIPIVAVVWTYNGLLPDEMSGRINYFFERMVTTQVNDIASLQSEAVIGYGVIKIFFQPGVDIDAAEAQVTAAAQTVLKFLPPGTTPPYVLAYNATTVPILQLALSGQGISQFVLFDLGNNFLRPQLASVPGAAIPLPYGGLWRHTEADLNLQAMQENDVSPADVTAALNNQNLIIPAGTEKIGRFEWHIRLNSSPAAIQAINDMPIKRVNGTVVYMRDIAFVHDGAPPQTNLVRVDGRRAVLVPVFKAGSESTLDIVAGVKRMIPLLKEAMPKALRIHVFGDQSVFVKEAVAAVVREAVLAALFTGLLVLLFLGDWRSTLIIVLTIPLSALFSLAVLAFTGQTINSMTLGGLALAVGILVDAATVTLENFNYHLEQGKDILNAILDGARQIVSPSMVSLLAICIVFVPMLTLTGVSHFLFVPLAQSVIYALVGAFLLSISFVPMTARYWLKVHHHGGNEYAEVTGSRNPLVLFQQRFEHGFNRMREGYAALLERALYHSWQFVAGFLAFIVLSLAVLEPWLGSNFFPQVDGGAILLHVSAPTGTRIEDTARLCDRIEEVIRRVIRPADLESIVDNIDIPYSPIDMAYQNTGTVGPEDGDITVQEKEGHLATAKYVTKLRKLLPVKFPSVQFSFLPADISTQILNFGAPAPVDVQVQGPDRHATYAYAVRLERRIRYVPGTADVHIFQRFDYPMLNIRVNRSLAQMVGLTQADVARALLEELSGSFQLLPNFWLNWKTGVSYPLQTMMPQYRIDSLADLYNMPVTGGNGFDNHGPYQSVTTLSGGGTDFTGGSAVRTSPGHTTPEVLGALASITPAPSPAVVSHYNAQPVIDIYVNRQGRDLAAIDRDIRKIIAQEAPERPPGAQVSVRGQVTTMTTAYRQLFAGLAASALLVYLLITVNFQSWLDPFVVITALPAALAGIVWILFLTHTTLSVPALIGSIMCMGIASANSILVISFARERLANGASAFRAAVEAGVARIRPVLITAGAMIIGMLPTALSAEQNAPLGRAVIGGLAFATVSTLFFVPVVFALVHRGQHNDWLHAERIQS
jgi:multidrug efflux pump subunit AcrB